jgi:GTP-binding protein EngB required for normal cell division
MTKSDKVTNSEKFIMKKKAQEEICGYNNIENIITFSAKDGEGVKDALDIIEKLNNKN